MSTLSAWLHRGYLRTALGRAHWHRRFYRPSVSVVEGTDRVWIEERGLRLEAQPLAALSDAFEGRCNVWLSGPSVKAIRAPERIAEVDWMGVNGSPRVFGENLPPMRFYHVNDTGFICANLEDFLRFAQAAEYTLVDYRAIFVLLQIAPERLSGIRFVVYDSWAYPLMVERGKIEQLVDPPRLGRARLSPDPRLGLPAGGTVAYTGAQALAFWGYHSIYFYGLDLSNSGRAYAEKVPQPQMLDKALESIIVPSFQLLVRERREVRFINCNPDSKLPAEVVPKIEPEASFRATEIEPEISKT